MSAVRTHARTHLRAALAGSALLLVLGLLLHASIEQTPFADAANAQVYWGTFTPGIPWDNPTWDALEAKVGKKQSIVHWGYPWNHPGPMPFPGGTHDLARARGAISMMS